MKFRAYKRDDERGYLIQGVAFSTDEEDCSVGFVLQRVNFPSYKSTNFELGTEAKELGRKLFDLVNDVFTKYGKLNEVRKIMKWTPKLTGSSFDIDLYSSWHVEENEWKSLTQEIEERLGLS